MGPLGDAFPEKKRAEFVDRSLVPGTVLYLFCPFTKPPKSKYLLLVCVSDSPEFFVINTTPNAFLTARFPAQQVRLPAASYLFLAHDSFVDCSSARQDFENADLKAKLMADVSRVKGSLLPQEKAAVVKAIQGNRAMERNVKNRIVAALTK